MQSVCALALVIAIALGDAAAGVLGRSAVASRAKGSVGRVMRRNRAQRVLAKRQPASSSQQPAVASRAKGSAGRLMAHQPAVPPIAQPPAHLPVTPPIGYPAGGTPYSPPISPISPIANLPITPPIREPAGMTPYSPPISPISPMNNLPVSPQIGEPSNSPASPPIAMGLPMVTPRCPWLPATPKTPPMRGTDAWRRWLESLPMPQTPDPDMEPVSPSPKYQITAHIGDQIVRTPPSP